MFDPTDEQRFALERFRTGRPLKVVALAGTGKTTTLMLLAQSRKSAGLYLAFNKSIATEAREKFPGSVDCRTTHSIAWRSVQPTFRFSSGKMKDSMHPRQLAQALALQDRVVLGGLRLNGIHQAHLMLKTLRNFCQSADENISRAHVPQYGRLLGVSDAVLAEIQQAAVRESEALWKRMTNHRDSIPLGHDGYLKLWALNKPKLDVEFILLDEAQDTNPVVLGVLHSQAAQIVYVGDRHQQIYEWRGAINAMEKITDCEEAYLTQSFRFGSTIAAAASQVLRSLGETKDLSGNPRVNSTITSNRGNGTILARTNATVMLEVLDALNAGLKPCVIGGVEQLKRLLSDVFELKENRPGICPEFFGFQNWGEVVAFSETEEGEDIRMFVQLVEQHGERRLWAAVKNASDDEDTADVIVSTAHKAKGREWDTVRLANDFLSSRLTVGSPLAEAEVRLFYVAMTRAKRQLCVDPEVLTTFTSGAWRTRRAEPTAGQSSGRDKPSRAEKTSTRVPPISDPARAPRPVSPPRAAQPIQNPTSRSLIQERISPNIKERHPGAAPSLPKPPSLWRRVARLFVQ